ANEIGDRVITGRAATLPQGAYAPGPMRQGGGTPLAGAAFAPPQAPPAPAAPSGAPASQMPWAAASGVPAAATAAGTPAPSPAVAAPAMPTNLSGQASAPLGGETEAEYQRLVA